MSEKRDGIVGIGEAARFFGDDDCFLGDDEGETTRADDDEGLEEASATADREEGLIFDMLLVVREFRERRDEETAPFFVDYKRRIADIDDTESLRVLFDSVCFVLIA